MKHRFLTLALSLLFLGFTGHAQNWGAVGSENVSKKEKMTIEQQEIAQQKAEKKQEIQKIVQQKKALKKEQSTAELTPNPASDFVPGSKAQWDILYTFDAVVAGAPGIETDGTNFYTTLWNGADFHRYDMDGSNPVTFTVSGASNIRDMAYVESTGYFYGSDASMNLYVMDLANETLVNTISASCSGVTGIRHIAYDPTLDGGNGGFWVGNWEELGAIAMDGSELVANSATPTLESCYGSAYDSWTDPANPKLWLFQQPTGVEAIFYEFDINTLSMTGVTHDASDAPGYVADAISGGACSYVNDAGIFVLTGCIQQDPNLVVGYELAVTADPTAPGEPTAFTATPDAGGALTVDLAWTNPDVDVNGDALTELTSIDVYLNDDPTPIYTNASPTIGGSDSYTATAPVGGEHTFKVIGTNSSGEGLPATTSVFVGVDVEVTSMTLPEFGAVGDVITPEVTVTNNGVSDQTFDVTLDDGDAYSETITVTDLPSGDQQVLTFPDWTALAGMTYTFTATATDPGGDIDLANNTMTQDVVIFDGCEHTIELTDSWGDGWNGNTISIIVGGATVLDHVTVETGTTATYSFFAESYSDIQVEFYAEGSYVTECSWEIFDGEGNSILVGDAADGEPVTQNTLGYCAPPGTAPEAPTAFTATADPGGAFEVDLAWTNPANDINGDPLAELTSVDVYINGDFDTPIYSVASPTIGGAETYTATFPDAGEYVFYVMGANSEGNGLAAIDTAVVGIDVAITALNLPNFALPDELVAPEIKVFNNSPSMQTFDVTLVDEGTYNETMTVTDLAAGDTLWMTFPDWSYSTPDTVTLTATAADPGGDYNLTNNEMSDSVIVGNFIFMQNGSASTCDALFFDSGGPDGDFQNDEDYVYTITPDVVGNLAQVEFTFFDCAGSGFDYLEIYNGTTTSDPLLVSSNEVGDDAMLDVFTASNPDGALTFHFVSSSVVPNPGWEAIISCYVPPEHDLAVDGIAPSFINMGDAVAPTVNVLNNATNDETTFDVQLVIDDGSKAVVYDETVSDPGTVTALGGELMVTMPDWTPSAPGVYTMTANVILAGDEDDTNDTLEVMSEVVEFTYEAGYNYGYSAFGTYQDNVVRNSQFDGTLESLAASTTGDFLACGDFVDGKLMGVESGTNAVYYINGDGTQYPAGTLQGLADITGIAYDMTTGTVYAVDYDGTNSNLYTVDASMNATLVGAIGPEIVIGIAMDTLGNLYGVELTNDNFISIDVATGAQTVIGALGVDLNYAQDIGSDRVNNKIYGTLYYGASGSETGGWCEIDVATGTANVINDFGDEVTMCAVKGQAMYPINFTVVDENTDPCVGANINVDGYDMLTDDQGEASMMMPNGTYDYTVTMAGYEDATGTVTVEDGAVDMPVIMYFLPEYNVTFNVDMRTPILMGLIDHATDTISVTGSMVGWVEPGTDETLFMDDADGDSIFSLTMSMLDGDYTYKYFHGAGWDGGEWQGGDDRSFTVAGEDLTLDDLWANEYMVTFTVHELGTPVENAAVTIDGVTDSTDMNGNAWFALQDGDYEYTASLDGYADIVEMITVSGVNLSVEVDFVGISDADAMDVNIYPNPTSGTVNIRGLGQSNVTVLNAIGKVIATEQINGQGTLNLNNPGVYFIRLQTDQKVVTKRVIVE